MRFVISVIDSTTGSATPAEIDAIDTFNARLVADGHWVLACGLAAPSSATVIDGRGPTPVRTDGPLVPAPEYVSGFWMVDAPDHDAAVALATEASRCCNRRVELRPTL